MVVTSINFLSYLVDLIGIQNDELAHGKIANGVNQFNYPAYHIFLDSAQTGPFHIQRILRS